MRFEFRLEKMLSWIRLKETTKKMELAVLVQRVDYLRNKHRRIENQILDNLSLSSRVGDIDLNLVTYQMEQVRIDRKELEALKIELENELQLMEKKRSELARLSMRRRGLESLKEKRHQEFRLQESRRQQKQLDDAHQLLKVRKI